MESLQQSATLIHLVPNDASLILAGGAHSRALHLMETPGRAAAKWLPSESTTVCARNPKSSIGDLARSDRVSYPVPLSGVSSPKCPKRGMLPPHGMGPGYLDGRIVTAHLPQINADFDSRLSRERSEGRKRNP